MSGDVRRCLELLRRAAEITEAKSKQAAAPGASLSNQPQPSGTEVWSAASRTMPYGLLMFGSNIHSKTLLGLMYKLLEVCHMCCASCLCMRKKKLCHDAQGEACDGFKLPLAAMQSTRCKVYMLMHSALATIQESDHPFQFICLFGKDLLCRPPDGSFCSMLSSLIDQGIYHTGMVKMSHVDDAINEMFQATHMQMMRNCCRLEKMLLASIHMESRAKGRPSMHCHELTLWHVPLFCCESEWLLHRSKESNVALHVIGCLQGMHGAMCMLAVCTAPFLVGI